MHMLEDQVVPISPEREKFFGCSGKMLLPCPTTVAALIEEVPSGRVATMELLRRELARRNGVEAVCPFQTKQAIRAIASESGTVPFWRLVKKNGELLPYLPGGVVNHARLLKKEQVQTEPVTNGQRVKGLKEYLMRFEPDEG